MIKIDVKRSRDHIAVSCVGHANYNTVGQDIVCAAISSLPKYISNFPYFTGFPACALAK